MIRVLVAEDSPTQRQLLTALLSDDPEIEVVGTASNGQEAVEQAKLLRPDLITLDLDMPIVDGYEAVGIIMAEIPTPVIIISASVGRQALEVASRALRLGAVWLLDKLPAPSSPSFDEAAEELISMVKAMAHVKVIRTRRAFRQRLNQVPLGSGELEPLAAKTRVAVVVSSTGGPMVLSELLAMLKPGFTLPIVVVQHMARGFIGGLVDSLDRNLPLTVKLAESGERLRPGHVYFAPDDYQLGVNGAGRLCLDKEPAVEGFRPAGSYLFASAARAFGAGALAIVLTGMGRDGVSALSGLRQAGGVVLAQDEASSVVFGIARAAIQAGAVDRVLSVAEIARALNVFADARN